MSRNLSRGGALAIALVAIGAAVLWTLNRDDIGPTLARPAVGGAAPASEPPGPSAALDAPSEGRPDAEELRAGGRVSERTQVPEVPREPEDAPAASSWTLRFVGEGGARLDGVEASVILWAGEESRRLERPRGSDSGDVDRWAIEAATWERATVKAWAPGYAPATERLKVRPGRTDTIELEPGASVSGRVVDRFGTPVDRADVVLRKSEEGEGTTFLSRSRTGEGGRFRIGSIAHGSFELVAERAQLGRAEPLRLELLPRGQWEAGDVVLLGSGEIAGRAVYSGGQPARDVRIRAELLAETARLGLRRAELDTDERGCFHFRGMAEGEYQLEHSLYAVPGFGEQGRARTSGGEVLLVLEAGKLKVRAVDAEGREVGMLSVELTDLEAGKAVVATTYAEPRVSLTVHVPPAHRYLVRAEDPGDASYEAEVELLAGEAEREVILRPPSRKLASLQIAFRGPDGALLTGFKAVLEEKGTFLATFLHAPKDLEDGVFTGLEPGTYALELQPSTSRYWESDLFTTRCPSELQLTAGQVTYAEATAARGGRIELDLSSVPALHDGHRGTLTSRAAASSEDAFENMHVFRRKDGGFVLSTGPELGFTWLTEAPLPPGGWALRLEAKGYRRWEQWVMVQAGETTPVRVSLERE